MPKALAILLCHSGPNDLHMTADLTEAEVRALRQGSVHPREVITHRRVLNISIPIVIANATVPILGAVDTGVVGQMGLAAPIGAVGMGALVLSAFYWVFGFLRMGTVGLTAQAAGQGDDAEVAALLTRGLLIGAGAGVAVMLLQWPLFWIAFKASPASPEVETLARQYMTIRVWSAPAAISLFAITGWLIAQERTRAVLVIQLWMNGLNVALDLWFVLGLGWGVQGVAFATFLAEWSGAALGLWFCRAIFVGTLWRIWANVFDRARWTHMMRANSDILVRSLLLEAMFITFLFRGAAMGDVTLAANQVLMQFLMITAYGLDGFAFAAEALVGNAMGAKRRAVLRRAAILASFWAVVVSTALTLTFWLAGPAVIDLMAKAQDVRDMCRVFLPYIIAVPLLSVAAFMFDGIFIGATRTRDMRNMMVLSFGVFVVCVLLLVPLIGNHGLWVSLLVSFVARAITLAWKYPALEAAAQ